MSVGADRYFAPLGSGEAELIEKRSRFIARVRRVQSEEEARRFIEETKSKYHDARHTCWCYIIRESGIARYSDDGEPQGTAGAPMLEVFSKNGITDVCCTVTRYFGGVLLGPGGLVRAYSSSARDALQSAGIAEWRCRGILEIPCPYNLFDKIKSEIQRAGGIVEEAEYGEKITLRALFEREETARFSEKLSELTAGTVHGKIIGEKYVLVEREE